MDVRCTGCNKLFRVSDDKIIGSGVKFTCTRCHQTVKITREEFEQHKLAGDAALLLASVAPKPLKTSAAPSLPEPEPFAPSPDLPAGADDSSPFDLSDPATAAASLSGPAAGEQEGEIAGLFDEPVRPEPAPVVAEPEKPAALQTEPPVSKSEPSGKESIHKAPAAKPEKAGQAAIETRPQPVLSTATQPKPAAAPAAAAEPKAPALHKEEIKTTPKQSPVSAAPAAGPEPAASLSALLEKEGTGPAPVVFDAAPEARSSGLGRMVLILAVVLLAAGAAFYGVQFYLGRESGQATQTPVRTTSPEGLQIVNPSAGFDSAKGDLVITGTVENTTDTPKPAWLIVVDVYDAQNALITKARLLNGKQLYTKRDLDILVKRGADIDALKAKSTDPAVTIPPKGSVNFEIRILEAPAGVSSFNPVLQPYDPIQIYKELAEDQK